MIEQFADKKIVIIGLGLIGGSLARALVAAGCQCNIIGVGRDAKGLQQAIDDGSITSFTSDVQTACADADIIVVAVPVLSVETMLREIAPVLAPHAIITDVASVKHCVVEDARKVFGSVPANFVPGHPIAGSEQSGYPASKADLFNNRKVILTPLDDTSPEAVALVDAMWRITGAEVLHMAVAHHDEVLAATSHLPHLLAFALVDTLSQQGESEEIFRYAAGGFRDFTRIASSDPVMWRDIFVTNGAATVKILDEYVSDLQTLRAALVAGDADLLHTIFTRARKSRGVFLEMNKPRPTSTTESP
jgi:prephenate dehydrogenase